MPSLLSAMSASELAGRMNRLRSANGRFMLGIPLRDPALPRRLNRPRTRCLGGCNRPRGLSQAADYGEGWHVGSDDGDGVSGAEGQTS